MKGELPSHQGIHARRAASAGWLLSGTVCFGVLALSCGSGSDAPASGGAANGGAANGGATNGGASNGGATSSGGTSSVGESSGQAVDCAEVCGHVKVLCTENSAIGDVWVDACKSACDARVQLTPNVAELERACVTAAADCNAAINCVVMPR